MSSFSRIQKIIIFVLSILIISGIAVFFILPAPGQGPITKKEVTIEITELTSELEQFEKDYDPADLPDKFFESKRKLQEAVDITLGDEDIIKAFKKVSEARELFIETKLIIAKKETVARTEEPKPDDKTENTGSSPSPADPVKQPVKKPDSKPEQPVQPSEPDHSTDSDSTYTYSPPPAEPVTTAPVPVPVPDSDSDSDYNYTPITKTSDSDKDSDSDSDYSVDTDKYISDSGSDNNSSGSGKVNINTASQAQLETLSGIGPVKARSIIDYRNSHGAFRRIEDIQNVSGIGPKTFDRLKSQITVGDSTTVSKDSGSDSGSDSKTDLVNINTATIEQLDAVPFIGPKTAQSIVEYREANGPFSSVDDLKNVPRIGDKTIERIKPYLKVKD